MTKRDSDGKYKKGQSGNPTGRPKGIRARAQAACDKHGTDPLDYMAEVLADVSAARKDRISCAKELADRLYGKAIQYNENTNIELNDKEFKIEFVNPKGNKDGGK